jgi:uncharacterized damage-inducible protein DinB
MPSPVEQARLLLAYNEWANDRVLLVADDLSPARFDELTPKFDHLLGTQRWWHAKWTSTEYQEKHPEGLEETRGAYVASHADLRVFAESLTDETLERSERWWDTDQELSVGELIVQVVNHGTQHRAEIASAMTMHGRSPGDLDYLAFRVPR